MTPITMINPTPESILSARLLSLMAVRVSERLAVFSSWLVGSFAALLALLISNLETIHTFLPPACIGTSSTLFLFAVGLHVVQRYLFALVSGSYSVGTEVEAMTLPPSLNVEAIWEQLEKATLWPARILVKRTIKKMRVGDLAAGGRLNATLAQIQGFLVLTQMVFVVAAGYVVARAL
jgi:hypothetical protein